jgi:cytochrome c oxidase subunit 4
MANVTNESRLEERHMQEEHHSGVMRYIIVFVALCLFTLLTVWTGRMDLGSWSLPLALLIATTKGALVALFFMHLVDHKGANRLVFAVALLFVLLLLFFVMADLGTRFRGAVPAGSPHSALQDLEFSQGTMDGRFGGGLKPEDGLKK